MTQRSKPSGSLTQGFSNPPFPFPSLVVEQLPANVTFDRSRFFTAITQHYKRIGAEKLGGRVFNGVPEICFTPAKPTPPFDLQHLDLDAILKWDNQFVTLSGRPKQMPRKQFRALSEPMKKFRRISSLPNYVAHNVNAVLSDGCSSPISLCTCRYDESTGYCENVSLGALDVWFDSEQNPTKFRKAIGRLHTLPGFVNSPFLMAGVTVLTVTPDGNVLFKERSDQVATDVGLLSLVPAGSVEPFADMERPSLVFTFLKELDEELFRGLDTELTTSCILAQPHINRLSGYLEFLGFSVSFTTRHINFLLRFTPQKSWWNEFYLESVRLNCEFEGTRPKEEPPDKLVQTVKAAPGIVLPACASALILNGLHPVPAW